MSVLRRLDRDQHKLHQNDNNGSGKSFSGVKERLEEKAKAREERVRIWEHFYSEQEAQNGSQGPSK